MTGAAAASLLTGCSSEEPEGRRTSGSAPDSARTEAALRRGLAAASGALRDQYDAVIAQHPSLARKLTDMREAVAEHAKALGGSPAAPAAAASAGDPGAALKALGAAERRTSDAYTTALADAEPELARLLASVAAAGAAHAYLLSKGDS
ncbi:hypothetical protein [Streptomyces sp. NBC_01142]|uniref:hypothetical protein n=1 Tax=Streptomyces sp. NBC_01142 TaxID=2975865 RepID=UPI002B1D09A0|nr:hypothetical protein [Streptomyces sp. NBC_01142]